MLMQRLRGRVEAAHRQSEAVLKVQAADLAVGDDVESDRFLQRDELAHACKLDCL
jgi:hypothetical protein